MEIIPAIDIIGGKCVRLTKGDYSQVTHYADDPVEVARQFEAGGIKRLHVVDLDGAKAKHVVNLEVLRKIASATSLKVDFGGGVKTREDLEKVLEAGAAQVTAGSIAVSNRAEVEKWISEFGAEKIILGADVLNGKVMVSGWQENSGEELTEFLTYYLGKGISHVICTDITKDGVLQGPSFELYQGLLRTFPGLRLIASGGVSGVNDLVRLKQDGLFGAIVGKAFYEGKVTLEELSSI